MPARAQSQLSRRRLIQGGMAMTAATLGLTDSFLHQALAEGVSQTVDAEQRWTIGNQQISRTIVFKPGKGLYTEALVGAGAKFLSHDFSLNAAREFSLQSNGHTYTGLNAKVTLLGAEELRMPNGRSLIVRLLQQEADLAIAVVYLCYDGHPAIRKHLVLHNRGTSAIKLSHLNIESLALAIGSANEIILDAQYGAIPRETFYTGRSEDAGLLVGNSRTGVGVAVLSEVPGYMKRTEIGTWSNAGGLSIDVLYDTDLMPFERSLAPEEEFKTAAVSLVCYRREDGFHDPRWVLPSYTAQVLERRIDSHGPPWIYNTWEPFERGINQGIALELIEAAATMGIDIFTIDDGWQQEYGDNAVNLESFPGGLQPIQDALKANGMRLGLWIPMAAIGVTTAEYRSHPEYAALDIDGNLKTTSTMSGAKAVMCLASRFRDAAATRINDAIERFHLAYVKLDITTIFNAYGEAPGCWAKGHDHHSWAESLNRIYEGIAYVAAKVYAEHPDVLLDLTFELWGQKHIIDAGLLAAGDLDWMSNVDDKRPDSAGPIQARQLLYQRATSMPVEAMLIGNLHAEVPSKEESFATAIGSAPLLLGDLRKLSAADKAWYQQKIAWFKSLRKKNKISEGFFPLGSWRQTRADKWDGFARLAHTGDGLIALFRNQSQSATAILPISVMVPGKFKLRSAITGKDLGTFVTDDFRRGISIDFSGPVEILEVTAVPS